MKHNYLRFISPKQEEEEEALFLLLLLLLVFSQSAAQEFISIWRPNSMPKSKGMQLSYSISNERIRRIGTPGIYTFFASKQENKKAAVLICP